MSGPADAAGDAADTDTVLDVVAMIEARLRHDPDAFTYLLDQGDNRAQAYLLAGVCAHLLAECGQDGLLAELRQAITG